MKSIYRSLMAAATILFFSSAMIHAAGDGPEFDAKKQKWGFREASGKWKVKPQFSKVTKLPEGGYLVEKEGKKGYFNGACEKVAFYDVLHMDAGCERLREVLEKPRMLQQIADAGLTAANERFTWKTLVSCNFSVPSQL